MSKFFKLILVALVLFVNLAVAQPSWAGKDFTKGADYAEVTQELTQLLSAQSDPSTAGYTPEQYQQRLAELQMQKYVIETARKRAQCRNQTGQTLAVYANKPKKSPTQLYFLAAGEITDDDWDCDGIYLPAGAQATFGPATQPLSLTEPVAIKVVDGTQLVATTNAATGGIELNVAPAKVFKAGETTWTLPSFSQAQINAQVPTPELID
ncbi:hypothetical protein [Microcoleus vaginatus]|uniref:hypothetical protein n=1 Tax=Microcoleus vaginatus TaxID=119532 RepID=UPI001683961C|nr:hypothetical protein [Microcoleus sp. FACHB-84]MBD2010846.1 hypothetical protein [Microcoleus sp. FACHB-45]